MSSSLHWEPKYRKTKSLSDQLKFALRKRHDDDFIDAYYDSGDISYLEGLRDAGIEDAQTLIDAIEKHSEISVMEK